MVHACNVYTENCFKPNVNCLYIYICILGKTEPEVLDGVAPDHGPQFEALGIGEDDAQPEVVGEQVARLKNQCIYNVYIFFF